jgi:alkylation response protein AidB-like acyl-CoA dehydrogenase
VLGGDGDTTDLPVQRRTRETKVMQILQGTTKIQRPVIRRSLAS